MVRPSRPRDRCSRPLPDTRFLRSVSLRRMVTELVLEKSFAIGSSWPYRQRSPSGSIANTQLNNNGNERFLMFIASPTSHDRIVCHAFVKSAVDSLASIVCSHPQ